MLKVELDVELELTIYASYPSLWWQRREIILLFLCVRSLRAICYW